LVGATVDAEEFHGVGTLCEKAFVHAVGELGFILGDLDEVLFEQANVNLWVLSVHMVNLQ